MELNIVNRPWGYYVIFHAAPGVWVKEITVNPGARLSLQYHSNRDEYWIPTETGLIGEIDDVEHKLLPTQKYCIPAGVPHRLINPASHPVSLIEIATGRPDEFDIVRLSDDYGRAEWVGQEPPIS